MSDHARPRGEQSTFQANGGKPNPDHVGQHRESPNGSIKGIALGGRNRSDIEKSDWDIKK